MKVGMEGLRIDTTSSSFSAFKAHEFVAHSTAVNCVAIGPTSGQVLATGGEDKRINVWVIGSSTNKLSINSGGSEIESLCFSEDETHIVSGNSGGAVKLYNLEAGGKVVRNFKGHRSNVSSTACSACAEKFVASGALDTNVKLWNTGSKECVMTFKGHSTGITSVQFSPDSSVLASSDGHGAVKLWDLRAGKMLHGFKACNGAVGGVRFNPQELLLAVSTSDRTIRLYDVESMEFFAVTAPDSSLVRAMAFDKEGDHVLGASSQAIRRWAWDDDAATTRLEGFTEAAWGDNIRAIELTRKGQVVAAAFNNNFVSIWAVDLEKSRGREEEASQQHRQQNGGKASTGVTAAEAAGGDMAGAAKNGAGVESAAVVGGGRKGSGPIRSSNSSTSNRDGGGRRGTAEGQQEEPSFQIHGKKLQRSSFTGDVAETKAQQGPQQASVGTSIGASFKTQGNGNPALAPWEDGKRIEDELEALPARLKGCSPANGAAPPSAAVAAAAAAAESKDVQQAEDESLPTAGSGEGEGSAAREDGGDEAQRRGDECSIRTTSMERKRERRGSSRSTASTSPPSRPPDGRGGKEEVRPLASATEVALLRNGESKESQLHPPFTEDCDDRPLPRTAGKRRWDGTGTITPETSPSRLTAAGEKDNDKNPWGAGAAAAPQKGRERGGGEEKDRPVERGGGRTSRSSSRGGSRSPPRSRERSPRGASGSVSADHPPSTESGVTAMSAAVRTGSPVGMAAEKGRVSESSPPPASLLSENDIIASVLLGKSRQTSMLRQRIVLLRRLQERWSRADATGTAALLADLTRGGGGAGGRDVAAAAAAAAAAGGGGGGGDGVVVACDFIRYMDLRSEAVSLDMCVRMLPVLYELLQVQQIAAFQAAAVVRGLESLVRKFGRLIRDTRNAAARGAAASLGVNLAQEERQHKCSKAHQVLINVFRGLNKVRLRYEASSPPGAGETDEYKQDQEEAQVAVDSLLEVLDKYFETDVGRPRGGGE